VSSGQTIRDAVIPFLPSGVSSSQIGIIDATGSDFTLKSGSEISNNTRVLVNQRGIVAGWPLSPKGTKKIDKQKVIDGLESRIVRLQQVQQLIESDHAMAGLIDDVIGQRLKSQARRQQIISIVSNIVFLVAGWLLSG
jgi:hypothetical protein